MQGDLLVLGFAAGLAFSDRRSRRSRVTDRTSSRVQRTILSLQNLGRQIEHDRAAGGDVHRRRVVPRVALTPLVFKVDLLGGEA